jgi:hypothetical protein
LEGEKKEARPVAVMLTEDFPEEDARDEALEVAVEVMDLSTEARRCGHWRIRLAED